MIKIKIPYDNAQALAILHDEYVKGYKPELKDDRTILLGMHLILFRDALGKLLCKERKVYTWKLDTAQCLAFCMVWEMADLSEVDEFKRQSLQELLNALDKYRKNERAHMLLH